MGLKTRLGRADPRIMFGMPPLMLLVNGLIAATAIGGFLYAIAVAVDNETRRHRLCIDTHRLHQDYTRRLAALRGELDGDLVGVDVIEDEPAPEAPAQAEQAEPPARAAA